MLHLLAPEIEATYEILREMGVGGMGAVYQVRHRVFGEICVIKVMRAGLQQNAKLRERFESEARRGKQISHPNIASVLGFQVGSNGNAHLMMEFIDGFNLRQILGPESTPQNPQTVAAVGMQTLAALGCLHEHHLVHRDISPENLMLTENGDGTQTIKLIDLGIAKSLDDTTPMTEIGSFLGKSAYAAPEQFSGVVDGRSDLYSLAIVLYELATGIRPITGTSTASYAINHEQMAPLSFSQTDPTGRVPEGLRRTILKALEKRPENRYQSAQQFAEAIHDAIGGPNIATITVPPPPAHMSAPPTLPPTTPDSKHSSSYRRILAAASVVAVALISVAAAVMVMNWHKPNTGPAVKSVSPALSTTSVNVTASNTTDATTSSKGSARTAGNPPSTTTSTAPIGADEAIDRGKKLTAAGKIGAAYEAFREAIRIDPANVFAWTNFGAAAQLLNKPVEATHAYKQALSIQPDNWLAHYNLGCQYARDGKSEQALSEIEAAVLQMQKQTGSATEAESILKKIRTDDALKDLQNNPRFRKAVGAS